jgi:hypothetical protein
VTDPGSLHPRDPGIQIALKLSCTRAFSQLNAVAPVGLDAVPCTTWNLRRRNDLAAIALGAQGPLQPKASRSGFVHEVQLLRSANLGQQFEQFAHIVNDFADQSPRSASGFGNSHRNAVFVDIQAHVNFANLCHGRSPLVADDESHSM